MAPRDWSQFGRRNERKVTVGKLIDLVKRRPKNHDIMEIIVRNSTNFTEDVLDEIRRAAPKLEIDWGCREDMELELEMEGDTQSDPESEEDTNTDDETDVDRECQDWYEE